MTALRFVCRPKNGLPFVTDMASWSPRVDLPDSGLPASRLIRLRPLRNRPSTIHSDGSALSDRNWATLISSDFRFVLIRFPCKLMFTQLYFCRWYLLRFTLHAYQP